MIDDDIDGFVGEVIDDRQALQSSACLVNPMICSSVGLELFMSTSSSEDELC